MSRYSVGRVESIKNEKMKKGSCEPKKKYSSKDLKKSKTIYTGRGSV